MKKNEIITHFGNIKFVSAKGFGFIKNSESEDVFFTFKKDKISEFVSNDKVAYNLVPSKNKSHKYRAINVRRVYESANKIIVVNRTVSHLHEEIEILLESIISSMNIDEERDFIEYQKDFDEIIGETTCVEIDSSDKILFAKRKNRNGHSKFVIGRKPTPTNSATLILKKVEFGYIIITAFIGKIAKPEPWDDRADEDSIKFWNEHALVISSIEEIIFNSATDECPWDLN